MAMTIGRLNFFSGNFPDDWEKTFKKQFKIIKPELSAKREKTCAHVEMSQRVDVGKFYFSCIFFLRFLCNRFCVIIWNQIIFTRTSSQPSETARVKSEMGKENKKRNFCFHLKHVYKYLNLIIGEVDSK